MDEERPEINEEIEGAKDEAQDSADHREDLNADGAEEAHEETNHDQDDRIGDSTIPLLDKWIHKGNSLLAVSL